MNELKSENLTVGSLFSGVGGFELGFEQAGWKTLFQVEWDKHCQQVLAKHWPDVPKWGDVSEVNGRELPFVDCLIFGSPCQDLSIAGKRAGLSGERSGLFYEAMRIIAEMREVSNNEYPKIIVWENVAGALTSNDGEDFGQVLNEMAEAGALVIEWAMLDAQHFGVPQRRRRIFVIAIFDPTVVSRCPEPLLPVSESVRGDSKKGNKKRKGTASSTGAGSALGDGTSNNGELDYNTTVADSGFSKWSETEIAVTLSARDYKSANTLAIGAANAEDNNYYTNENSGISQESYIKVIRSGARDKEGNLPPEVWRQEDISPTLNSFDMGDTRAVTAIVEEEVPEEVGEEVNDNSILSFDTQFGSNAAVFEDISPTLKASQQSPSVLQETHKDLINKGFDETLINKGFDSTLSGPTEEEPLFFQAHHSGEARVQEGVMHTLAGYMGTGGNNTPMVVEPTPIQGSMIGRSDHAGPAGKGYGEDGGPMFTLNTIDRHAVAYDEYNNNLGGDVHHSLRAGTRQSTGVITNMTVRRLTPLECERLMGWPDDWTRWRADGKEQADSHRYKQCGNGVASPVAKWIANHLKNLF